MKRLLALLCLLPAALSAADWTARPFAEIAVHPEFRAPAEVVAVNEANIAAELSGRIDYLPARVGERVAKGGELARIDPASYQVELERARAQVELLENRVKLAEAQLAQTEALAARGFISGDGLRIKRTELAVLRSELAATRQGLEAARLQLSRTVIRAPYDGVVRERLASVGDLAVPGTPLLVFAADDGVEVRARVPAAQIDALRAARDWRLAAGTREVPLVLLRVSPLVSAAGQAQVVVFAAREAVPPGLAGELRWASPQPHLPAAWVQQRNSGLGVWLVRGGRPVFEPLPQAEAARPVPVDLPPDALLVDEGRHSLELPAPAAAGAPQ
jgi:RND family efflux transporter MFP subunit